MLCMLQFNGYFGCPHCFMRGVSHQNRMLYPCNAPFVLRNKRKFEEFGQLAEIKRSSMLGIKKRSPLCNVFKFPWDAPLDPMHQIFLGTGKVLSKSLLGLLKGDDQKLMSELIKSIKRLQNLCIKVSVIQKLSSGKHRTLNSVFSYCSFSLLYL